MAKVVGWDIKLIQGGSSVLPQTLNPPGFQRSVPRPAVTVPQGGREAENLSFHLSIIHRGGRLAEKGN